MEFIEISKKDGNSAVKPVEVEKFFDLNFILNEIYFKFIATDTKFIFLDYRDYFVALEEARWYLMDFYAINSLSLKNFSQILLLHSNIIQREENCLREIYKLPVEELTDINVCKIFGKYSSQRKLKANLSFKVNDRHSFVNKFITPERMSCDYFKYTEYKKSLHSYGAIILSPDLKYFLLVKQMHGGEYTFPKGKLAHNELPRDCAIREAYEEAGIDISNHITNFSITIFSKITFFIAVCFDTKIPISAKVRNEISEVLWVKIDDFSSGDFERCCKLEYKNSKNSNDPENDVCCNFNQKKFKLINSAFSLFQPIYNQLVESMFTFDKSNNFSKEENKKLYDFI